jgi:tetratricopeptide (TPR) repeat protein
MKLGAREKKFLLTGRHSVFSSRFFILFALLIACALVSLSVFIIRKNHTFLPGVSSLYREWNAGDYTAVYENAGKILEKRPLDGAVLALKGFSAYYLYVAQNDPAEARNYLVSAIVSLRNAWYRVSDSEKGRIAYVLGKAYYQRGYYYADLSLKYLDYALKAGVKQDDLQEFRGLAASLVGDYETAIPAFTEALAKNPSDLLLFTLAKSYASSGKDDQALQYFQETIRKTGDELLRLKCHYEIGMILITEQRLAEAEAEFTTIIQKEPNSADAQYGLGVIYETQGDLVKARAAWRKALRLNPVHAGARDKMDL